MPQSPGSKINQPVLKKLMGQHGLQVGDVASFLERSESTVRVWLAPSGVDIPDHSLQLLEFLLNESE